MGDYPVSVVNNHWITLSDNVRLACRSWLPFSDARCRSLFAAVDDIQELFVAPTCNTSSDAELFPVILEILPYWKDVYTLERDFARHTRFAQLGYVVCRVEMRGTGSSDGLYFDEYTEQEMRDTEEVIEYLGTRPYSNGKVAMFGKSWGGFNGLQLAARQPEHLAAVISAYSTDDRFGNDVHYLGGCIVGDGMVNWANIMQLWNARPPHPKYCADWKEKWLHRLDKSSESWLKLWLSEQDGKSPYWKHGSIMYAYDQVKIPVLLIGGVFDGYTDGAFRMTARLNSKCKAIIGPYGHGWPDNSRPGPNIDFMEICDCWLTHHCKGVDRDVDSWPRLSIYLRDYHTPETHMEHVKGSWIGLEKYSDSPEESKLVTYQLTKDRELIDTATDGRSSEEHEMMLKANLMQGFQCGQWMSWGAGEGLPGDQTIANSMSACWIAAPFEFDVYLCGYAWVHLKVKGRGQVVCRLCCDDETSGMSTLVSYGAKAVNSPDAFSKVPIPILPSTFTFSTGRRLKLAIAPSCFPKILPCSLNSSLTLQLDEEATLSFQQVEIAAMSASTLPALSSEGKALYKVNKEVLAPGSRSESFSVDLDNDIAKQTRIATSEAVDFPEFGLQFHETAADIFKASMNLGAVSVRADRTLSMKQTGLEGDVAVNAKADLEHKGESLELSQSLRVTLGGRVFFERSWKDVVPNNTV